MPRNNKQTPAKFRKPKPRIVSLLSAFLTLWMCASAQAIVSESSTQADAAYEQENSSSPQPSSVDQSALSEEEQYWAWAKNLWQQLDPKTGEIVLAEAGATLNVPESFYFLDGKDAETVLVEIWGNPPGQNVLGMLFPAGTTPFDDDSWGVSVEYEQEGYVSDDDAQDIDYSDLLSQMQEDTRQASQSRQSQGYESIELVGWAAAPFYDAQTHKMHWAKELKFGGQELNTLNYNIRVLGRQGVLVLNFIAGIEQQSLVEENLETVLDLAEFDDGSRYADFDPDLDQVAAYGLGALVAGKVVAKTGFFALALVFLKKFGVYILLAAGALLKTLWGRKKN